MTMHLAMTAAGLAAIADASNIGTSAVRFTKLAVGAGTGTGDQSARTALIDQKAIADVTGQASGDTRIAIRADYSPTENFIVTEAGLFARIGAGAEFLAAYWVAEDANGALASAAADTALIVAGLIAIEASSAAITVTPAVNISVGVPDNVVLKTDHATTEARGIVELATTTEARTGTDTERAVTPAGLEARIGQIPASAAPPNATTTRRGLVELATNTEVQTGTDTERAVTPAGLEARIGQIPASAAPPNATTTRRGLVELATNTEVQTGTDTERAVTPAGLASRTATTSRKGVVELATATEAKTGTDSARAVTPAGLAGRTPNASASVRGLVELATTTEAKTGTDTERAVTPAGLAARVPNASTSVRGIVELATNAEVITGTDSERAVTPAGMKAAIAAGGVGSISFFSRTAALNLTLGWADAISGQMSGAVKADQIVGLLTSIGASRRTAPPYPAVVRFRRGNTDIAPEFRWDHEDGVAWRRQLLLDKPGAGTPTYKMQAKETDARYDRQILPGSSITAFVMPDSVKADIKAADEAVTAIGTVLSVSITPPRMDSAIKLNVLAMFTGSHGGSLRLKRNSTTLIDPASGILFGEGSAYPSNFEDWVDKPNTLEEVTYSVETINAPVSLTLRKGSYLMAAPLG